MPSASTSGTFAKILLAANNFTLSAILVVAFSLLAYITLHNWRNSVARAFCFLLGSLIIVLAGSVLLNQARTPPTRYVLWCLQWLGIVMVPAAYGHFATALLHANGPQQRWLRIGVPLTYSVSALFWLLAITTNSLVQPDILTPGLLVPFEARSLFGVLVIFVILVTAIGVLHIRQARHYSVTPANRRRLSYLSTSFMAPTLGVLPYLLLGALHYLPFEIVLIVLGTSTTGVGVMITLMTYSVAYHGVIVPDRVVKYNFLRYILYGPVVGVTLIVCLQVVEPLTALTGLPRETIAIFGVVVMTILMPMFIGKVRPTVDMLIYRQDRAEMRWLRDLERRAFTRSDLRQLLENTLVAVCGTLRVESGFVAAPSEEGFIVQASCGPRREIKRFLATRTLNDLLHDLHHGPMQRSAVPELEAFVMRDGFCLLPLHNSDGELLGAIGVACRPDQLTLAARRLIGALSHQMELALSHVKLQHTIFQSLRGITPQMDSLHQLTTEIEQQVPGEAPSSLAPDVAMQPEFPQLVKDALNHYWGGPKLSDSPLLGLWAVRSTLHEQGGSPTRALQAVLRQAIDNIRPDNQLDPTAPEWMLYNILELRFLKGLRIREIIDRLAMSESDYYRKQRVAVEEVARQLALMEERGGRS